MNKTSDLFDIGQGGKALPGELRPAVLETLRRLQRERVVERIWNHDYTVWKEDPAEISNRLGWLHSPANMPRHLPAIRSFAESIRSAGYGHALLLGMGGSSLAPEMFRLIFGTRTGYGTLDVLDSTDPGAILARTRRLDPAKTLFIVSTKSGGTVETLSLMKYFYNLALESLGQQDAGEHFIAITDPGSTLEETARELGFRQIFLNEPDIGGRYSALSYFGLLPAALAGVDIDRLLQSAAQPAQSCRAAPEANDPVNPGARLGAIIGTLANKARNKLTLITSPAIASFGTWVEQLIAESTGKEGRGILPVHGESLAAPEVYGPDRLFVHLYLQNDSGNRKTVQALAAAGHPVVQIELADIYDLGAEIFRWEMATAVAGHLMGINPFDQPNVESAKALARRMVAAYRKEGRLPEIRPALREDWVTVYADFSAGGIAEALRGFLAKAAAGTYVALQAYVTPTADIDAALDNLRTRLRAITGLATTVGYGPRFLHSTGQLHKGDAGQGLFIQFTADSSADAAVPEEAGSTESWLSFGTLKMAQSLGDRQALLDAGRRVIRFHLSGDPAAGLRRLATELGE